MNNSNAPTLYKRQAEHGYPSEVHRPDSVVVVTPRFSQQKAEELIEAVAVLGYN